MKLTVGQVLAAYDAFGRLSQTKLPAKGAYWVARLVKKLEPEYVAAEGRRVEIIKEVGEPKDGGFVVPSEKTAAFVEKWRPILEELIEVDVPRLKLEHLGDTLLLGADMLALEPFVEE